MVRACFYVMVVVALGFPCVAHAQDDAVKEKPRSTVTSRLRCVMLAAAVGPAAAAPGMIPLWVAGASKGLAVSNVITDAIARQKAGKNQDATRIRLQFEKDHLWFIGGMALLGSFLATAILWPGFALLVTSALLITTQVTDGLFTGLCREPPTEERPMAHKAQTAVLGAALLGLSLLALPGLLVPTVAGALLVMVSIGVWPAFPLIPGLGFVDLNANFKRAGILQTASWPMLYVSTIALGLGVTVLLLNLAPVASAVTGAQPAAVE